MIAPRLAVLGLWLSAGCATSIAPDISRVRELARVDTLPPVAEQPVDPEPFDEAERLLDEPLDVESATRIALLNNREVRAVLREMGVARGQILQARTLPNPTIEVEVLPERDTRFEYRIEYDLTDALLAPVRRRAVEPDLETARVRAASWIIELGYEVRVAFYGLQAADSRLALAQRVLDALAATSEATGAMADAGNVNALDVSGRRAAYERGRITVSQLELEVALARERLNRLLGLHGADTGWVARGGLSPIPASLPSMEDIETQALRKSLELDEIRHRLDGLAKRAGLARAEGRTPDIGLDVHALQGDPRAETRDWRFGAGISVGIPSFDRNRGTALSLDAEFDALMERYHGAAVELRSAARVTRSIVESAHARARHYESVIVPIQRQVTEQTLLQYDAMQLGIFDLLAALREQLAVESEHIEMVRDYWVAASGLDALLAGKSVSLESTIPRSPRMGSTAEARGDHK